MPLFFLNQERTQSAKPKTSKDLFKIAIRHKDR